MAGTRGTNTMQEGLRALLNSITDLKVTPDADLEWLIGLETQVLQKLREPVQQIMGQTGDALGGMQGGPSPMSMSPGGGGAGGPMGTFPAPPGGGVPGVMSGSPMPNPDELRRLIGSGAEAR